MKNGKKAFLKMKKPFTPFWFRIRNGKKAFLGQVKYPKKKKKKMIFKTF